MISYAIISFNFSLKYYTTLVIHLVINSRLLLPLDPIFS